MTEVQLTHYASWASIISLFISLFSLLYLRSIIGNFTHRPCRFFGCILCAKTELAGALVVNIYITGPYHYRAA